MYPTASAGPDQPPSRTDPAQLPALLQQLVADLVDPAIGYVLGARYYERTNHPRSRHFPAVFALHQVDFEAVEDAGVLYTAPEVLSAYARQGRLA